MGRAEVGRSGATVGGVGTVWAEVRRRLWRLGVGWAEIKVLCGVFGKSELLVPRYLASLFAYCRRPSPPLRSGFRVQILLRLSAPRAPPA